MANEGIMTGGCACGEVRYKCKSAPIFMFLCHCVDCRRATGSAYAANVWFLADNVSYESTEPDVHTATGVSGADVNHQFCKKCGSPIGMWSEAFSDFRGFRASSFDDPTELQPTANVWTSTALPWEKLDDRIKSFPTQPTDEELEKLIAG